MSKIAIFSDQHLPRESIYKKDLFLHLLSELRDSCTELWLLGDVFDLFVGHFKFWKNEHALFFAELAKWTHSGKNVLWIEGNHDFHIETHLKDLGVTHSVEALTKEVPLKNGTKPLQVYLAHGDLVDQEDAAYLKWRSFIRHPLFVKTLERCPEIFAKHLLLQIAEGLSGQSRKRDEPWQHPQVKEIFRSFARARFSEGFDAVFLGHSHVYDLLEEKGHVFLNLGSWLDPAPKYAIWEPNENIVPSIKTLDLSYAVTKDAKESL
jgi:UDP-2,3-diacylglucosamine hydrolase